MRCTGRWVGAAVVWGALMLGAAATGWGQQVVQRGAMGKPAQVLDETGQWTVPFPIASDHDVEIYMPDVSGPDWLKANYSDWENKGQYVLSLFTFYKTTRACQQNQIAWGFGDQAHLDACLDIGYRVRRASVDTNLKTVTLITAAMVGQDGQVVPGSVEERRVSRPWSELDASTQKALGAATAAITKQMDVYNRRLQAGH